MSIVGLTHDQNGNVKVRRTVTTKVAIGLGPGGGRNYPTTIDHFRILKKGQVDGKAEWVLDEEKQAFYKKLNNGQEPTSLSIVLLDDDPEAVLKSEYAWYKATGKVCWGDGEKATRRTEKNPDGVPWTPCANHNCPDLERGDCKPSGDLYFMLADFPSLGTACRLHTSSYQSIPELHSALIDLRSMFGGRLLGLPVKLFMRPEKNVYMEKGERKTGKTKYILGLEVSAANLPKMLESVSETAKVFSDLRQLMAGKSLEIEDDPDRDEEVHAEFYPAEKLQLVAPVEDPLIAECKALMEQAGVNAAGQSMMLGQYQGNLAELKANLERNGGLLKAANATKQPVSQAAPEADLEPKGKAVKGRRSQAAPAEVVASASAPAATAGFDF